MKFIGYVFQSFFLLLIVGVAGLFLFPMLPIEHNIELRIVQSGSMEPSIMTGSLVMVQPRAAYQVGDVITFNSRSATVPTTHRIVDSYVEAGQTMFITKGDANEEADAEPVARSEVKGLVQFAVPRLGYILEFTRQPLGFGLLIVLPAFLIILSEIEKIWRELRGKRGPRKHPVAVLPVGAAELPDPLSITKHSYRMMDISTPVRYVDLPTLDLRRVSSVTGRVFSPQLPWRAAIAVFAFTTAVVGTSLLGYSLAYPHDSESSIGNTFGAIALDFSAVADNPVHTFAEGGIVGGDGSVELTILPEPNSAAMYYDVSTRVAGGKSALCDVLAMKSDEPIVYNNLVTLLTASPVTFTTPWTATFSVTDDSGLIGGETCDIEFVFTAWYTLSDGEGYFDEEVIKINFSFLPTVLMKATSFAPLTGETTIEGGGTQSGSVLEEQPVEEAGEGTGGTEGVDKPVAPESAGTKEVPEEEVTEKDLNEEAVAEPTTKPGSPSEETPEAVKDTTTPETTE
jgi:signal peptidase